MAKPKKVSKIKVKKKRWFPIFAPKFVGQKELGESYLNEAEEAIGRTVKINLRDLTGSISDQNINISLKINEAKTNNLYTEAIGYEYMSFFIKKLAKRNSAKVDDSFVVETKDKKKVRFKPMVLLVFKVNNSVKTAIRKKLQEELGKVAAKTNFESLLNDMLKKKLQVEFKKSLNKICPVKEVVMRVAKIEERKRSKVLKVVEETEEA